MIKRLVFTSLLIIINAISFWALFTTSNSSKIIIPCIFFSCLLIAYIFSWSSLYKKIANSKLSKNTLIAFGIFMLISMFPFVSYQIFHAILDGKIFAITRRGGFYIFRAEDPMLFWLAFTWYLIGWIGAITLPIRFFREWSLKRENLHNAKQVQNDVDTTMENIEKIINLIDQTSTARELEIKSRKLLDELSTKQSGNHVVQVGIKGAKSAIMSEIRKRLEKERKNK